MKRTKATRAARVDLFRIDGMSGSARRWWKKAGELAALVVFTLVVVERDAHAYLEPGSFNFIIQSLIGVALGAAIYIKLSWGRIKVAIRRLFASEAAEEEEEG